MTTKGTANLTSEALSEDATLTRVGTAGPCRRLVSALMALLAGFAVSPWGLSAHAAVLSADAANPTVSSRDALAAGFQSPPPEARPELFWDWMHDLVTREGITHDLEAMKRAGFSGALIMLVGDVDAGFHPGHNMPNPVPCMSPEFFAMWKFAVQEADRLGLTLISQCGPGWCHSGGPWIQPAQAVQHLASSEVNVTGPLPGAAFTLAQGASASLGYHAALASADEVKWVQVDLGCEAVVERVVLQPLDHVRMKGFGFPVRYKVELSGSPGFERAVVLSDRTAADAPNPGAAAVTIEGGGRTGRYVRVTATRLWKRPTPGPGPYCFGLAELEVFSGGTNAALRAEVSGKDSVEDFGWSVRGLVDGIGTVDRAAKQAGTRLALAVPGQDFTRDIAVVAFPRRAGALRPEEIVELTGRVREGVAAWDVPAGEWTVRRYGLRNANAFNRVAPAGGRGLECDKLSKDAVKALFDGMVGRFIHDAPELAGKSIAGMEADSWEVGKPEWSPGFREEFRQRRGYDPIPWLVGFKGGPAVGGGDLGARFAYDVHLTQNDLFADNFFSYLTDLCRAHGLEFMTEAYFGPFDPVRCGGRTARPMGEVWASSDCMHTLRWAASAANTCGRRQVGGETFTGRWSDGAWTIDPYALKRVGDLAFCNGLNKMTLHGTALQPWADKVKPGMPMGFWGTMFTPGQTWWEPGRAWVQYLARCQFMLQQGRAVADILGLFPALEWKGTMPAGLHKLYNYDLCAGETLERLEFRNGRFVLPASPAGSGADMTYRVLLLPPTGGKMEPALLRKLIALVEAGGTVVCSDRPSGAPGLTDYPRCDDEARALADRLWGACDGQTVLENRCGKGRLVWMPAWSERIDPESDWIVHHRPAPAFYNRPAATVTWSEGLVKLLRDLGVEPDVEVRQAGGRAQVFGGKDETACGARAGEDAVAWIHRREGEAEFYFVASQVATPMTAELAFRVDGKVPEFWDPETGRIMPAAVWRLEKGRTVLPVPLAPFGSMFVVFRPGPADPVAEVTRNGGRLAQPAIVRAGTNWAVEADADGSYEVAFASGHRAKAEVAGLPKPMEFGGAWDVRFPAGQGAPAAARMELKSWTAHSDAGVRYFSGTAAYVREFDMPAGLLAEGMVQYLDLGTVKNLAEVAVNGRPAGVLWKPPFRLEVTPWLRPGRNRMEIKVTNLWLNRMVGDEQYPDDCEWLPVRRQCNDFAGQGIQRIPDWVWTGGPRPQPERVSFTTWKFYNRDTPLLVSGLLGPVTLQPAKRVTVQ